MTIRTQVIPDSGVKTAVPALEPLLVDNVLVEGSSMHYGDRDDLIIQCTEMTTDAEMDALVTAIESIAASVRETVTAR